MYWIIEKSGMYLSADYAYSSVWYASEDKSYKIWNQDTATFLAKKHEGYVLPRSAQN